jgi:hypothetical protein
MANHRKLFLSAALALLFPALTTAAEIHPELFNARALALGGAIRAVPSSVMAARINPAALGPIRGFFGGLSYEGQSREENGFDAIQVTLVDNQTSNFAGAIQYSRRVSDFQLEDLSLSIAGGQANYFGGTLRYIHGRNSGGESWESAVVGDLGVLAERPGGLRIAVTGQDLFASKLDFLDPRAALGLSFNLSSVWLFSADFVRHLERDVEEGQDLHMGLEWSPRGSGFAFRLGYMYEGLEENRSYATGIGWKNEEGLVFGYAVMIPEDDATRSAAIHAFSVQAAL